MRNSSIRKKTHHIDQTKSTIRVFVNDHFDRIWSDCGEFGIWIVPCRINNARIELLQGQARKVDFRDSGMIQHLASGENSVMPRTPLAERSISEIEQWHYEPQCLIIRADDSPVDELVRSHPEISSLFDLFNIILTCQVGSERIAFYSIEKTTGKDKLNFRTVEYVQYALYANLFSRNSGILEVSSLAGKGVVIAGCGSVGSFVALELARTGIGNFLLIDNDVIKYHNLSRHQCGLADVGRLKVEALRDRILDINPMARVSVQAEIVETVPKLVFDKFCSEESILVGCADNREGDLYLNRLAFIYNMPFLSIGFWERAFAGEIFYTIPHTDLSCYECLYEAIGASGLSNRQSTNRRFYITDDSKLESFEPGISTDIVFVATIGVKLAIDLINRGNPNYRNKVLGHLQQFTLVCNYLEPANPYSEIFLEPLQITSSIVVEKQPACKTCSGIITNE